MIKRLLYASLQSSNAVRTLLTAARLGIEHEVRMVQLGNPDDRKAIAGVNPNGKIPVLVEGDYVLWESNAIDEYLCDLTPGQTLLPAAPRAKAEVHRWLYWITAHFGVVAGGLNFERFVKQVTGRGEADPVAVAGHEAGFHQFARVVDSHLANHEYLANDALSLADYSLASVLLNAETAAYPIAGYAHLVAHRARIRALPAWRQVFR
ncbi:glutathione S-transferase N-terminal domain-containing protein [soil metagenome]